MAFSSEERGIISATTIKNETEDEVLNDINDKVYLLSEEEEEAEFYFKSDEERKCEATKKYRTWVCWWLRTHVYFKNTAGCALGDGHISYEYVDNEYDFDTWLRGEIRSRILYCVRPVINVRFR